tara:strand:- start:903 stop:1424 length:522 start_codon:yes stop_codon:yes gene_type:complete
MIRAAMLDSRVYEEVEADYTATLPAMLVVLLSSISGAFAPGSGLDDTSAPMAIILAAFFGIVSWAVWAGVTYVIGAKLLPEPTTEANWGQLARTTGFAQAPGLLGIIGVLSGVVSLIIGIWGIVAMVIAVRQALDYTSTIRAVAVVVLAFIPSVVISLFVIVPVAGILGLGSN